MQLEPAVLPSYTIPPNVHKDQFLACRRARFLRRNFFLRHFQRWLPVFFQAREPRFMVNVSPTCSRYMSASGRHSRYYPSTFDGKERSERLNAISHAIAKSELVADVPVSAPQTHVAQLEEENSR